ncbi:MAG: pro-sigmaK processing inhibitor BofA family protein [Clostridia bacterium]|nr:pro-sigmaK processing inhibitor BofA family protein [Clostridia bacterium]
MEAFGSLPIIIVCALVLWIVFKLLKWPLKIFWKLLINMLVGFVILFLFNLIGGIFSFTIEINWLSSLATGIFGIPGVIVLAILTLMGII